MKRQLTFSLALIFAMLCEGCAVPVVGERAEYGTTKLTNPSPVTLHIEDADKQGTASGIGPARYTSISGDRVETMQTGTVPRDVFARVLPDGTMQFNLSSGTDIAAKGLEYDPKSHKLKLDEFSTSASEPLKAHAAAYDVLTQRWNARDKASQDTVIGVIKAIDPALADAFALAMRAAGVP